MEKLPTFTCLPQVLAFCNLRELQNLEEASETIRKLIIKNPQLYGRAVISLNFANDYK